MAERSSRNGRKGNGRWRCYARGSKFRYRTTINHGRTTEGVELATEETVEVVAEPMIMM